MRFPRVTALSPGAITVERVVVGGFVYYKVQVRKDGFLSSSFCSFVKVFVFSSFTSPPIEVESASLLVYRPRCCGRERLSFPSLPNDSRTRGHPVTRLMISCPLLSLFLRVSCSFSGYIRYVSIHWYGNLYCIDSGRL